MKRYFKYKSLSGDSFKYFVKMLIESKMYAACFKELNDPMEGAYLSDKESKDYLQSQKEEMKIISLVEKKADELPCNMLMWSHYSNEHRGCCVEFHFKNKADEYDVCKVNYIKEIKQGEINSVESVLCRKFEDWKYEQEVRYIGLKELVPIEIDKIYLGMRIDDLYDNNDTSNETFYRELINRLCPHVKVDKMRAEDFDGHHTETLKE